MYESDITRFLKDLRQARPKLEQEQREGRDRLWDRRPIDLDEMRRHEASRVPQRGYVYQSGD